MDKALKVMDDAIKLFIRSGLPSGVEDEQSAKAKEIEDKAMLNELIKARPVIRTVLQATKAVLGECSFEVSYTVLPPSAIKPIASKGLERLVSHVIALVGACESKYSLVDVYGSSLMSVDSHDSSNTQDDETVRPVREKKYGDKELLNFLLQR